MAKLRSTHGRTGGRTGGKSLGKQARFEADGQTHRRDCECPRCEAGFVPTDRDRELAGRRAAAKQGRLAATRAWERKKEAARLRQTSLEDYFRQGNAAADAEVQRLRGLREHVLADRRLEELLRLRKSGVSLSAALAEVDRRFPESADNDNGMRDPPSRPMAVSGERLV